jgi:hypothetical protein
VEFAVEFAEEIALAVRHVPDRVQMLANQVGFLFIASTLRAKDVGQCLCGLFETTRGAVLCFRLRQQVEGDHEEGVDWIVRSIQRGRRRVPMSRRHNNVGRRFLQSGSAVPPNGVRGAGVRSRFSSSGPRNWKIEI